ncbi:MAG: RICIN domain-containing protein [Steroidobacteraceae bacterium]
MNKVACVLVSLVAITAAGLGSCATTRQISSGNTNLCMNVVWHGYPVAGTPLRVRPCDPWQNQQWSLNNGQITGVGGFCVDVQGSAAAEGAPIVYVPCIGSLSQQWTASNGAIVGIGGMCLDIGSGPPDAPPIILATCRGSPGQQWVLH